MKPQGDALILTAVSLAPNLPPMKILLFSLMILNSLIARASDASSTILAPEPSRPAALLSNAISALNNLLSDALRYVHRTGKRENKQAVIDGLVSKQVAYERFE